MQFGIKQTVGDGWEGLMILLQLYLLCSNMYSTIKYSKVSLTIARGIFLGSVLITQPVKHVESVFFHFSAFNQITVIFLMKIT